MQELVMALTTLAQHLRMPRATFPELMPTESLAVSRDVTPAVTPAMAVTPAQVATRATVTTVVSIVQLVHVQLSYSCRIVHHLLTATNVVITCMFAHSKTAVLHLHALA